LKVNRILRIKSIEKVNGWGWDLRGESVRKRSSIVESRPFPSKQKCKWKAKLMKIEIRTGTSFKTVQRFHVRRSGRNSR